MLLPIPDIGHPIIAPSFADIFATNCLKNGLLPVLLPEAEVVEVGRRARDIENYQATVDLEQCRVSDSQGFAAAFAIDEFQRQCLLAGLDDIGLILQHETEISAFERRRPSWTVVGADVPVRPR